MTEIHWPLDVEKTGSDEGFASETMNRVVSSNLSS
jgi:hypothetical protein